MNHAGARASANGKRFITANTWANNLARNFSSAQPPLVLALDVDETLWRTHFPDDPGRKKLPNYDFVIDMRPSSKRSDKSKMEPKSWSQSRLDDMSQPRAAPSEIYVKTRPGLREFFDWIQTRRSEGLIEGPWVFTQGSRHYINKVLPEVDPTGEIFGKRILSRKSCTPMKKPWPWVHKDLYQIPCGEELAKDPMRVVLVENNPMSCLLYPKNSLMVHDWMGHNASDRELERVSATLDAVLSGRNDSDYASRLASMTPGFDRYRQALAEFRRILKENPAEEITASEAIRDMWMQAVEVKTELINQQFSSDR